MHLSLPEAPLHEMLFLLFYKGKRWRGNLRRRKEKNKSGFFTARPLSPDAADLRGVSHHHWLPRQGSRTVDVVKSSRIALLPFLPFTSLSPLPLCRHPSRSAASPSSLCSNIAHLSPLRRASTLHATSARSSSASISCRTPPRPSTASPHPLATG